MMKWIQSKGIVEVDATTLLLTDLRRIYNEDQSPTKSVANSYLAYIHIVSQIDDNAPYFKADSNEVRRLAKKQLFRSVDFEFSEQLDTFLEDVIRQYREAYELADARAARIFKEKVDKVLVKIETLDLQVKENTTRTGTTFTSNFGILSKMMNEVIPMIDAQGELEARVKKMNKADSKIRGNKTESILNKRQLKE